MKHHRSNQSFGPKWGQMFSRINIPPLMNKGLNNAIEDMPNSAYRHLCVQSMQAPACTGLPKNGTIIHATH